MRTFPWPPNETGPWGSCRQPHHRYGPQGSTLCASCDPQASAPRISKPEPASASLAHPISELSPDPGQLELFA
jgi:hypothetical protein